MSTAEEWARMLESTGEPFTMHFERLGLTAQCRRLSAAEVEECRRMGGERGMRYALYLACDAVRDAAVRLRQAGKAATPLDATEGLPYADVMAAGQAILRQSGAQQARLRVETPAGAESGPAEEAVLREAAEGAGYPEEEAPAESADGPGVSVPGAFRTEAETRAGARRAEETDLRALAEAFADRLQRARANR